MSQIDYSNLKHKILQTNEMMISHYLGNNFLQMEHCRILLNEYINKAIEFRSKKNEKQNSTKSIR